MKASPRTDIDRYSSCLAPPASSSHFCAMFGSLLNALLSDAAISIVWFASLFHLEYVPLEGWAIGMAAVLLIIDLQRQQRENIWGWNIFSQPFNTQFDLFMAIIWFESLYGAKMASHYSKLAGFVVGVLGMLVARLVKERKERLGVSSWLIFSQQLQQLIQSPSDAFRGYFFQQPIDIRTYFWRFFLSPWLTRATRPPKPSLSVTIEAKPGEECALYTAHFSSEGTPLGSWKPFRFSKLQRMHNGHSGPFWPAFPSSEYGKNMKTDVENVRKRGKDIETYLALLLSLPECLPALARADLELPPSVVPLADAIHATTNAHAARKAAYAVHGARFAYNSLFITAETWAGLFYEDWRFYMRTGYWPEPEPTQATHE